VKKYNTYNKPIVIIIIALLFVCTVFFVAHFTSFTKISFLNIHNFAYKPTVLQKLLEQKITTSQDFNEKKPKSKKELFLHKLVDAAIERTNHIVTYDPGYVEIEYPGGDVPDDKGVCTDVVIRAYRKLNIDLQKEVHEDMKKNFTIYPKMWGLTEPDSSIDHRRVPNLMTFFERKGEVLLVTNDSDDYSPGDIVVWKLGDWMTHIGIVIDKKLLFKDRFMVVHNIGAGPKAEDVLFNWEIIGHYRYFGNTDLSKVD